MAMRNRTRITAVALVALVVLALAGVSVVRADPNPSLPTVAADELLGSSIAALAAPSSISGEVHTELDLGLPELPSGVGAGSPGIAASMLGSQRFKVWHAPDGIRVAHLMDMSEQTVVANRTEAWLWDSNGMTAEHVVYADLAAAVVRDGGGEPPWLADMAPGADGQLGDARAADAMKALADPTAFARRALDVLAPYAAVSVDGTARVAGRPVYELVLTPRSSLTLVGHVTLAIDAETRLPLRVQVFAKGARAPAVEAGFTSVSYDAIDPSTFTFTPPAGATVRTPDLPSPSGQRPSGHHAEPITRTFGSGFDSRVAIQVDGQLSREAAALLPYGGPLFSVLSVEAGGHTWLLVGSVGLDTLQADAATLA
jgi:hypothetical protein